MSKKYTTLKRRFGSFLGVQSTSKIMYFKILQKLWQNYNRYIKDVAYAVSFKKLLERLFLIEKKL